MAKRAQVSVGTVSNVLNDAPWVAAGVRQRVLAAIDELGYVRNETARRLRTGQSSTIGVIVPDIRNPFYTDVVRGAGEAAWKHRLSLILGNGGDDPHRERAFLDLFEQQRVRGVLIAPYRDVSDLIDRLLGRRVRVVLVDQASLDPRVNSVAVDDIAGGRLALEHLAEAGRRRVLFAGGSPDIAQAADRLAGATQAAEAAAVDLTVMQSDSMTARDGGLIAERLLSSGQHGRPDGIFAVNDLVALGIMQTLVSHGVRVPDDIAIVGFDDIDFAASAIVPLTSVRQPRDLLGATAVRLLLDAGGEQQCVTFAPELVARASTR